MNGAGKTTLLKMLIGELRSSKGKIYINGKDVDRNYFGGRENLGYCPQFSYLPEFLNVKESLQLFARLKGMNSSAVAKILDDFIKLFKLNPFRDKMVQHLRFVY